jgi:hypothetical protein
MTWPLHKDLGLVPRMGKDFVLHLHRQTGYSKKSFRGGRGDRSEPKSNHSPLTLPKLGMGGAIPQLRTRFHRMTFR